MKRRRRIAEENRGSPESGTFKNATASLYLSNTPFAPHLLKDQKTKCKGNLFSLVQRKQWDQVLSGFENFVIQEPMGVKELCLSF